MIKKQFGFTAVLGLSLSVFAQSQGGQPPAATTNDATVSGTCEQALHAQGKQEAACADYWQQVMDLKVRIAALKDQRRLLLEQCGEPQAQDPKAQNPTSQNPVGKDRQDCESRAELMNGRLSIMEQSYTDLLRSGCQQTARYIEYPRSCLAAAKANGRVANQNNSNTLPATSSQPGKNQPVTASRDQKQVPRRIDSRANGPGQQQLPRRTDSGVGAGQMMPQEPRQSLGSEPGGAIGRSAPTVSTPAASPNMGGQGARVAEPK
jgi:hypothetical protein